MHAVVMLMIIHATNQLCALKAPPSSVQCTDNLIEIVKNESVIIIT